MNCRVLAVAVCLAMAIAGGVVGAQVTPRTIWVQVTVTDAAGRLVTSLRREDFTILVEDGQREVTVFSKDELPVAVALMLDASVSMRKQTMPVRRAARLVIDQFVRGDRVNIGAFDRAVQVSDRFTANRARILWSLEQPLTGADTPCVPSDDKRPLGARSESSMPPVGGGGTAMWDGVWCGARELQRDTESIRKVMVVITDGMENSSRGKESTAVGLVEAAGVLIYTVGFRGTEGAFGRSDRLLRELAENSGGRYFPLEDKDPVEPVFARIGEELRGQYVLGFEPRSSGSAGKLRVTVKTPGLTARARTRYSAPGANR